MRNRIFLVTTTSMYLALELIDKGRKVTQSSYFILSKS